MKISAGPDESADYWKDRRDIDHSAEAVQDLKKTLDQLTKDYEEINQGVEEEKAKAKKV